MTEEITCPDCERSIARENAPFHALGHRVDKLGEGLKQVGEQVGEQVAKLSTSLTETVQGIQADPKLGEELTAVKDVLGKLVSSMEAMDATRTPEQVEAHIKDCPTCRQRWEPYFKKPEPKPEAALAPVALVTPAAPKRLAWPTDADVPGSALSQSAYRVERHRGGEGVSLRVKTADEGQGATEAGVVPQCRWVKGEDGYHYACEER